MARAVQVDRLSNLSDNLLCYNILSRLPLIDAIRTSILSSRWRSLWTQIPNLHFGKDFFESMYPILSEHPHMRQEFRRLSVPRLLAVRRTSSSPYSVMDTMHGIRYIIYTVILKDTIDKILLDHSSSLESFELDTIEEEFSSLAVGQWIERAARKGVKRMTIFERSTQKILDLPSSLFACSLLTHLELEGLVFTLVPTGFGGFAFLRTCSLNYIHNFTDEVFESLLGLCPLLQKLVLKYCHKLNNLNVRAPNLKCLNVRSCRGLESLRADTSQLVELNVMYCDCFSPLEINSSVRIQHLHASEVPSPCGLSSVKSLKKLSLEIYLDGEPYVLSLQGSFPGLEELDLVGVCLQPHFPSQAMAPSLMATRHQSGPAGKVESDFTFPNVKKAFVSVSPLQLREQVEPLAFLLRNAPSLKVLTLSLRHCPQSIHRQEFISQVRDFSKVSPEAELRILYEDL